MLHDENVSIFVYIYEKKICRIVFFFFISICACDVISVLKCKQQGFSILCDFSQFDICIFVLVLSFHHAAQTASSIFREISLP